MKKSIFYISTLITIIAGTIVFKIWVSPHKKDTKKYVNTVYSESTILSNCGKPAKLFNDDTSLLILPKDLASYSLDSQARYLLPIIEHLANLTFNNKNFTLTELSEDEFVKKLGYTLEENTNSKHLHIEETLYRYLNRFPSNWNMISSLTKCYLNNIPCFVDYKQKQICIIKSNDNLFRHLLLVKSLFLYILDDNSNNSVLGYDSSITN